MTTYGSRDPFSPDADTTRDAYGLLKYVRQVKTHGELQLLRTATELNQRAIEQTVRAWTPGITWQRMIPSLPRGVGHAGRVCARPRRRRPGQPAGRRSALHTTSGLEDFVVEPGMHIMWDCHGTWQHYCWDGGKRGSWMPDPTRRRVALRT